MYLRINNISKKSKEDVRRFLYDQGLSVDEFEYAGEVFFEEEAEACLRGLIEPKFEYKKSTEEIDKFVESNKKELSGIFFNDDSIISGETLIDITNDFINGLSNREIK